MPSLLHDGLDEAKFCAQLKEELDRNGALAAIRTRVSDAAFRMMLESGKDGEKPMCFPKSGLSTRTQSSDAQRTVLLSVVKDFLESQGLYATARLMLVESNCEAEDMLKDSAQLRKDLCIENATSVLEYLVSTAGGDKRVSKTPSRITASSNPEKESAPSPLYHDTVLFSRATDGFKAVISNSEEEKLLRDKLYIDLDNDSLEFDEK